MPRHLASGSGGSSKSLYTRVGSTTNSVSRTFLRDGAYIIDPVLKDGAATYTPGISERRGSATRFLHTTLKSADAQSNTSQAIASHRTYDAFGNITASSTGAWTGPFGYGGNFGYQEDTTGLQLLGHRYYDPTLGRFLTRDPIKDGRNWYAYCENDPVNAADPTGLMAGALVLAAGGVAATVSAPVIITIGIVVVIATVVLAVVSLAEADNPPATEDNGEGDNGEEDKPGEPEPQPEVTKRKGSEQIRKAW